MAKCIECGYLTVRRTFERDLVEAESRIRNGEEWPVQRGTNICLYERKPIRFVMAHQINDANKDLSAKEFQTTICEDRDCSNFFRWRQGFSPKEHREQEINSELRKWQEERDNADKKWREKQDKKLVYIAGGFTILGALIGALISFFA